MTICPEMLVMTTDCLDRRCSDDCSDGGKEPAFDIDADSSNYEGGKDAIADYNAAERGTTLNCHTVKFFTVTTLSPTRLKGDTFLGNV
jgi:hypothetical protein